MATISQSPGFSLQPAPAQAPATAQPGAPAATAAPATVTQCYELLHLTTSGGVHDFTDGRYGDDCRLLNEHAAYLRAQEAQAEYLLDEIACGPGSRMLDVGCGYGRILQQAQRRGASATGITISPPQVAYGRRQGLDVRLLNYGALGCAWDGQFDGLVANGSLEHFVQVSDAAAGRTDAIYEEMFAIFRRLLSPGRRLATTAIHFRRPGQEQPEALLAGPARWPLRSEHYHFALVLERTFGGWYPEPGQLERCAAGRFRLIRAEDGTADYRRTSEFWLRRLRTALFTSPRVVSQIAQTWYRLPRPTCEMLRSVLWDQSWAWQFRGNPPPTVLWRQTWEAV